MKATQSPEAQFENAVLSKIAKFDFKQAEFFNGTLFVETDEKNARKIFSELFMGGVGGLTFGRVQITPYTGTNEYAYDFI